MKRALSVILVLAMLFALAACGGAKKEEPAAEAPAAEAPAAPVEEAPAEEAPAEEEKAGLKIAVSLMNIDAFMSYVAEGAENYGRDNPNVEVTVYDAKGDANAQLTTIENALIQGVDAIVITPVDTDATAPITALCEEYGVPLVATNAKCSTATTTFVGSDNITSGEQEAQYIADLLGGEGKVVLLAGVLASQNGRDRMTGSHNILDTYEGIEILAEQSANVLALMTEAEVDIEYMYSLLPRSTDHAYMVFRVTEAPKLEAFLAANGIETVSGDALGIH